MVSKGSKTQISTYYMIPFTGIPHFLHFADIAFFLQTECLWQSCVEQVSQQHFPHFVSLCHILVILVP